MPEIVLAESINTPWSTQKTVTEVIRTIKSIF